MSRTLNRLKPLAVDRAKSPGRYADGGGLYLVVKPGPRKSWAFIYRHGTEMTELGLGGIASIALVAARAEAAELREVLRRALEIHILPTIGNLGVGAVDLAAVRKILEPIWYVKPRVAQVGHFGPHHIPTCHRS